MTQVIKSTIKTEVVYDDNKNHKYIVRKEWDKAKRKALVIMKNAGLADELRQDQTTMYVLNNLMNLGYGSVSIANIYSSLNTKETKANLEENKKQIATSAKNVDDVIIAVGKGVQTNKEATERLNSVLEMLVDVNANILEIEAKNGRRGFHPLCPAIKKEWKLVKYNIGNEENNG